MTGRKLINVDCGVGGMFHVWTTKKMNKWVLVQVAKTMKLEKDNNAGKSQKQYKKGT